MYSKLLWQPAHLVRCVRYGGQVLVTNRWRATHAFWQSLPLYILFPGLTGVHPARVSWLAYWLARAQAKHAASGMRDQMNTHHWNAVIYSLASLALYGFVGLLVVLAVRKLLVNCCRTCVHRGRLPALSTTAAYQAVVDLLPSMEYDVTQFVSLLLQCCTAEQFV